MPIPVKRPIKNKTDRITESREPKINLSFVYRPVLYDPKEYFFNTFKIFPIN